MAAKRRPMIPPPQMAVPDLSIIMEQSYFQDLELPLTDNPEPRTSGEKSSPESSDKLEAGGYHVNSNPNGVHWNCSGHSQQRPPCLKWP